jgi:signal transduction histidine kinase
VTIVEQRGRELLHLIETILDAARAEAGELTIAAEWTRVGDVVMAGVLDARDLVVGLDVQIVGEIQPGMPRVYADSARATQAITAVILSAVRFAESGMVRVRATLPAAGEELRIDVETTGRGLGSAERDRIFEAFRHSDRARKHGSLGLGPSLARSIIELHGGRVDVETTQEGGTVFHIWLATEKMKAVT